MRVLYVSEHQKYHFIDTDVIMDFARISYEILSITGNTFLCEICAYQSRFQKYFFDNSEHQDLTMLYFNWL